MSAVRKIDSEQEFRPFNIQRLKKPTAGLPTPDKDDGILWLDYMGNVHFEGETVPDAWNALQARKASLRAGSVTLQVRRPDKYMRPKDVGLEHLPASLPVTVYVLAAEADMDTVKDWLVNVLAATEVLAYGTTREQPFFSVSTYCHLLDAYPDNVVGWWDLKLGFFGFIDVDMFEGVKALFDVA